MMTGLHVVYDMSKPSGHRLVSVTILCAECDVPTYRPLQPLAYYGVAMPSYMALGGDGFEMFTNITEHVKIGKCTAVIKWEKQMTIRCCILLQFKLTGA